MIGSIIRSWRRSFGRRFLRGLVTAELLGQLAKKSVCRERLGNPAINRLVEEIIDRAEGVSSDSTEQAQEILNEAEKIAANVSAYFNDPSACDAPIRRILHFHVGSIADYKRR